MIRLFALGALLFSLSLTAADEDLKAAAGISPEPCSSAVPGIFTPKTKVQWTRLAAGQKETFLNRTVAETSGAKAGVDYRASVRVTTIKLATWHDEVTDPYGKWMIREAIAKSEGQPHVDFEGIALVGDPSAVIQIFRLEDGTVVGGRVICLQQGATKLGAPYMTFGDVAQARRKGYETRGRGWGIEFVFEESGDVKNGTPVWKWQGR